MHTSSEGVGRAIDPGAASTSPAPAAFEPKKERPEGALAGDLSRLDIKGLRIISSSGGRLLYSRDQSEIPRFLKEIMFDSLPELVLQARSKEAVSAALKFAFSRGVTVIPRGSGSSPFGGSVPVRGGIVLDVSPMDKVLSIDPAAKTVTVEAGARWADVDGQLEKHGLCLNTSPSSKFSTVGGWIATGGMGLNSFSKGHVRRSVTAIELVTPGGEIRRLKKDDPLFDTVFGSEGQLGIITSVTLLARERPSASRPHLLSFSDHTSALSFAYALSNSSVKPSHIVFENAAKFRLMNRALGKDHFQTSDSILVNTEGEESDGMFRAFVKGLGLTEEKEYLARYMWNERFFPMKVRKFGPGLLGSEVIVPLKLLPDAISKANSVCAALGLEPLFEVHFLDDGNGMLLCYYVTDQGNTIGYTMDAVKSMLITSALIDLGARPYSIGVWNNAFSDAEDRKKVEQLRKAKASVDPRGIMNAGKFFSLSGRFAGVAGMAFSPRLMRPALKTMLIFSPLTSRLMRGAYKFASRSLKPKSRTDLMKLADECAMCGACVSVCPAYLIVGDERVTARGKLLTAKAMARGTRISKEHSDLTFLCMRCKACEQVCQSKLELVSAYDILEKELEQLHSKDSSEIERFVKYVEGTPEYDDLVNRGLVLGAPKHGMGGGAGDV
jgi:FAD/FMN-containing dehydrogenase/ferredoxin